MRLLVLFLGWVCAVASVAQAREPFERVVIAISNGSQFEYDLNEQATRLVAETPLNHIGMVVQHHDWSTDGAPSEALTARARGALVWFSGERLHDPDGFLDWAVSFMESGRYIVLAGDFAFFNDEAMRAADPQKVSAFFETLGLDVPQSGAMLDDFEPLEIAQADPRLTGFERAIPNILFNAPQMKVVGDRSRIILSLGDVNGARSDVVSVTSGGGIMYGPYGYHYFSQAERGFWFVNPFAFFSEAFRVTDAPAPDVTTLAGQRIYFSHVDGDGWNSVSAVTAENGVRRSNANVMLDHLITPYPDLPVTVGPVGADIETGFFGSEEGRQAARDIFALPQVELATHTHTHPFDWAFFSPPAYDQRVERSAFEGQTRPRSLIEAAFARAGANRGGSKAGQAYSHESYDRPRAYFDGPFDMRSEIDRSIAVIESLAPQGKSVEIVLWPGSTQPFEEMVAYTRSRGLENMNGGETRYDSLYSSVSHISPLTRGVGDELQVLTAMVSEAFYTDNWTSRYYGFRDLRETMDRTESPVRLRPINIYYHAYSADRPQALEAVRGNIEHALKTDITPITASHYAKIVQGAFSARFERQSDGWLISDRGALNTIRFDGAPPQIDYAKSVGVLGHRDYQGVRYVALDPDVANVFVALAGPEVKQQRPRLEQARWSISDASFSQSSAAFNVQGFGRGEMVWRFAAPCAGDVQVRYADGSTQIMSVRSDEDGRVGATLDQSPYERARVRIECQAAEWMDS